MASLAFKQISHDFKGLSPESFGPVPYLFFTPTPMARGTESQGVVVEICRYKMGHAFKNTLNLK